MSEPETAAILDGGEYVPSGAEAFVALHEQGTITTVGDDTHSVTTDADYLTSTEWPAVVERAGQVRELLLDNDGPMARERDTEELLPGHPALTRGELAASPT